MVYTYNRDGCEARSGAATQEKKKRCKKKMRKREMEISGKKIIDFIQKL